MTRRNWPRAVPALAAATLCVLLAIALMRGPQPQSPPSPEGPASVLESVEAGGEEGAFETPPAAGFDVVVARNLFSIERTPPAGGTGSADRQRAGSAAEDADGTALTLTGVVRTQSYAAAILRDSDSSETVRLLLGERYRGWKLDAVGPASATLQRGKEEITLHVPFMPEGARGERASIWSNSRNPAPFKPRRSDEHGNPVPAARQSKVEDPGG